ncbi:hypothetical protein GJAV_G00014180 [Gymnothorax javanicus]|nr:hypothetical protein GJAV_G00014180 [Gymnothorax javanicus]
MMSVIVMLFLTIVTKGCALHTPYAVNFTSKNLMTFLTWEPATGSNETLYQVEYKLCEHSQWTRKKECWNISMAQCDLTKDIIHMRNMICGRVRAVVHGSESGWVTAKRSMPHFDMTIDPPRFHLVPETNSMQVHIDTYFENSTEVERMEYHIHFKQRNGPKLPIVRTELPVYRMKDLSPGTEYCISVSSKIWISPTRQDYESAPNEICGFTKSESDSSDVAELPDVHEIDKPKPSSSKSAAKGCCSPPSSKKLKKDAAYNSLIETERENMLIKHQRQQLLIMRMSVGLIMPLLLISMLLLLIWAFKSIYRPPATLPLNLVFSVEERKTLQRKAYVDLKQYDDDYDSMDGNPRNRAQSKAKSNLYIKLPQRTIQSEQSNVNLSHEPLMGFFTPPPLQDGVHYPTFPPLHQVQAYAPQSKKRETEAEKELDPPEVGALVSSGLTGAGDNHCKLPIVPVQLKCKKSNKTVVTYAFLDEGSTAVFCTVNLMNKLNLSGRRTRILLGTRGQEKVFNSNVVTGLEVAGLEEIDSEVELLIGTNVSRALEPLQGIRSVDDGPYTVKTILGWTVNGPLGGDGENEMDVVTVNRTSVMNLDELWRQQFEMDFPECSYEERLGLSREDQRFMELVARSVKLVNGHY